MKHGKAVYDLFLLVVLFWHRYMLKKQGIWTIQRTNSELLLLEKNRECFDTIYISNTCVLIVNISESSLRRSDRKERPEDIRELLRYVVLITIYVILLY